MLKSKLQIKDFKKCKHAGYNRGRNNCQQCSLMAAHLDFHSCAAALLEPNDLPRATSESEFRNYGVWHSLQQEAVQHLEG